MVASLSIRGAALVALCVLAGPAVAQTDALTGVLRIIGLSPEEKDPIQYRERPPLVVPPSIGKLRNPEEGAAQTNPNWPQDPDVLARKRKAEEDKQPVARNREYDPSYGAQVPLNEAQRRNRYAGVPSSARDTMAATQRDLDFMRVNQSDVSRALEANRAQQPTLRPGEEPSRQYLTEPPKGYRSAAAGAPVRATVEPIKNTDELDLDAMKRQRR